MKLISINKTKSNINNFLLKNKNKLEKDNNYKGVIFQKRKTKLAPKKLKNPLLPIPHIVDTLSYFTQQPVYFQAVDQESYLTNARLLSKYIAKEIEKHKSVRVIFNEIQREWDNKKAELSYIKGVKIQVAGRIEGVEMAKHDEFKQGQISLQTFSVSVDYDQRQAYTRYGVHGVKVWISKGTIFNKRFYPKAVV